jgi:catechol 2,3-dioxygenase-like lactoylglutathione lyase family enzyme
MPHPARSLHDRINRISHWDVNVTDLERSRAWYEAVTPLRVVAETRVHQPLPSLGIEQGAFRGYMMKDENYPYGSPMIHLVEWESPAPVGKPYTSQANVGWYRIVPVVDDIDRAREAVIAQNSEPFAPTTRSVVNLNPGWRDLDYRVFTVHDPDGVALEFGDKITMGPGAPAQTPVTVAHNTADVDQYISFYVDLLGLDFLQGSQTKGKVPNVYSPAGGETGFSGAFFGIRGGGSTFLDWLQWIESPSLPTPYAEPNHVGIVRCAIEVDNVDACFEILSESRWAENHKILKGGPEEWHFGDQFGPRKVLNFTDPEGVGFQLIEQPVSPIAVLHPYGKGAEFE